MPSHIGREEATLEPTPPLRHVYTTPSKPSSHKTNANPHSENSPQ